MKQRIKWLEIVGSGLILLSFAVQFFLLQPLYNGEITSYILELLENQGKIFNLIYDTELNRNVGSDFGNIDLSNGLPVYYDQLQSKLEDLKSQIFWFSRFVGITFLIGSALLIISKALERDTVS